MHKTVNHVVRNIVEGYSDDCGKRVPFSESILCIVLLASLGRRSYEVVTWMKPRLSAALTPGPPVQYLSVNDYVERPNRYFHEIYAKIQSVQRERAEAHKPTGKIAWELS